jgi:hypothetical protein
LFDAGYKETVGMLRESLFQLDFIEGKSFRGFTQGENWNGFACPLFTREQSLYLVDAWREAGYKAAYDEATDAFVFQMADGEQDAFPGKDVAGKKLYPIGAFCWIWDEATSETASVS